MPPAAADAESVLDEAGSEISKRATFWINISQKLGVPAVILVFVGWGGWIAAGKVWEDAVKPVVRTHVTTLDTLSANSTTQAAASTVQAQAMTVMAAAHQKQATDTAEQKEILKGIGTVQNEIKQVLKSGLKIQKEAADEHHAEKVSEGPPGTETPQ